MGGHKAGCCSRTASRRRLAASCDPVFKLLLHACNYSSFRCWCSADTGRRRSAGRVAPKLVTPSVQGEGTGSNVVVMRIQGPLCFANAARTKERILGLKVLHTPMQAWPASQSAPCRPHLHSFAEHCTLALAGVHTSYRTGYLQSANAELSQGGGAWHLQDGGEEGLIRHLVLDGAAMDFMDATGLEVLQAVLLKPPAGLRVVLADPSHDLLDLLKRGGVLQHLGKNLLL